MLRRDWRQFVKSLNAAAKREDGSAGGGWGGECRAVRANTNRGQLHRLLGQSRAKQNILFLLPARRSLGAGGEEKIGRAQNEKSKEFFSVVGRGVASGGGAASFVGGFPKVRSDFVQGVEPKKTIRTHFLKMRGFARRPNHKEFWAKI